MKYIPRLHITAEYTRDLSPPYASATCPYIPRLIEEHMALFWLRPQMGSVHNSHIQKLKTEKQFHNSHIQKLKTENSDN
jgi:hypothetical protein